MIHSQIKKNITVTDKADKINIYRNYTKKDTCRKMLLILYRTVLYQCNVPHHTAGDTTPPERKQTNLYDIGITLQH